MRRENIDWINVAKYGIVFLLVLYIVCLTKGEGKRNVSVKTIEDAILEQVSVEDMSRATNQELKKYYGLNASDYEEVFLYLPGDVMNVSELLVVKVKDKSQIEGIESAIGQRLDTQKTNFEGYGVEQTQLLKSAIVKSKGYYVFLAVSEDAEKLESIFLACIS